MWFSIRHRGPAGKGRPSPGCALDLGPAACFSAGHDWRWAVVALAVHGVVVLTIIKVRGSSRFGEAAWHFLRVLLELGDFWVYRGINPLFNTPALATPMFRMSEFVGLSST